MSWVSLSKERHGFGHDPLGDNYHEHLYTLDWEIAGCSGLDPRIDVRYVPTSYEYYDVDTTSLWLTQVPFCDDEALDYFTFVAGIRGANPRWVSAKRPSGIIEMLPYYYYADRDEVVPR